MFETLVFVLKQLLLLLRELLLLFREPMVLKELLLYLEDPGTCRKPVLKLRSPDIFLFFALRNAVEVRFVRYYGVGRENSGELEKSRVITIAQSTVFTVS